MKNICRICGNGEGNKKYTIREMMFGIDESFIYFECNKCRTLQIAVIPEDMSRYYPEDYYSLDKSKVTVNKISALKKRFAEFYLTKVGFLLEPLIRFFKLTYLQNIRMAGGKMNSNILDVGSGSGKKLMHLANLGLKITGADPFIDGDIQYSNGLMMLNKELDDIQNTFDIIMFNHSFEHLIDPLAVLRSSYNRLKDNGTLLIRIPVADSFAWKFYQEHWVALDAPRHIHLLTPGAIEILAKKAGFKIFKTVYESSEYQFWGSEQYKKGIPLMSRNSYYVNKEKSIFSKSEIKQYKKRAGVLNKHGEGDTVKFFLIKVV